MITLFAIPKPFRGHIATIQRNAIDSWTRLGGVDVVLFGDEEGVGDVAAETGCRHIAAVETNEYGTPLISSAFKNARRESRQRLLGYANADIVLLRDFPGSLARLELDQFLLLGQRWNIDVPDRIDYDDPAWESRLRRDVKRHGELSDPQWIDYFVLPCDSPIIDVMPPFVVGRPRWDNWMIRQARATGIPVIDATRRITAVHQRHDYGHVPAGSGARWAGPEADSNVELFGSGQTFGIWHATHVLTRTGLVPAVTRKYLHQRWAARDEIDGRFERLCRRVDPALAPARWLYRRRRARSV